MIADDATPQKTTALIESPNSESEHDICSTVSDVSELIEKEIQYISSLETRPGWTAWALFGALAGAAWLLTGELKSSSVNVNQVLILTLLLSFFVDIARICNQLAQSNRRPLIRYLNASDLLSAQRLQLSVEILRTLGLQTLSIILLTQCWRSPFLFVAWYGFLLLQKTLLFWISLRDDPLPRAFEVSAQAFVGGVMLIPISLVLFLYPPTAASIGAYRIAGLIATILLLLVLISRGTVESSSTETLIEIRRDLIFGNLDLATALRQIEITVRGMDVHTALRNDLNAAVSSANRVNAVTGSGLRCIAEISARIERNAQMAIRIREDPELVDLLEDCFRIFEKEGAEKHVQLISSIRKLKSRSAPLRLNVAEFEKAKGLIEPVFREASDSHRQFLETADRFRSMVIDLHRRTPIPALESRHLREALRMPTQSEHPLELEDALKESSKGLWIFSAVYLLGCALAVILFVWYWSNCP